MIGLLYLGRTDAMETMDAEERTRILALDSVVDLVALRGARLDAR